MAKASPAATAELKQRVLWSLSKLGDRDTQQYAVEDLIAIIDRLTQDAIPTFLTCLYDTDLQQKSFARKESVRLLGILAAVHGTLIVPHLSRMIANVVMHFKDQDSKVRDACAEAMGVIAAEAYPPDGDATDGSLTVFFRPLFETMSEQNRNIQLTAAASLSRVVQCTNVPLATSLPRLCPRIVKSLSAPNCLAKGPLLDCIRCLVDASGPDVIPFLPVLMPPVLAAFASPDWTVRKAGAQVLQQMAMSVGTAMTKFKESVMSKLEKHRFDKVKAVRDSISDALHFWKDVEDAPRPSNYSQYRLKHGLQTLSADNTGEMTESPPPDPQDQGSFETADDTTPTTKEPETPKSKRTQTPKTPQRSSATKPSTSSAKKPPSTGTRVKRTSLRSLTRNGAGLFGDKWAVEVAVPRNMRYQESPAGSDGMVAGNSGMTAGNDGMTGGDSGATASNDGMTAGAENELQGSSQAESQQQGENEKREENKQQEGTSPRQAVSEQREMHGTQDAPTEEDPGSSKSPRWKDSSMTRSVQIDSSGGAEEGQAGNAAKQLLAESRRQSGSETPNEMLEERRERRRWGQPEDQHLHGVNPDRSPSNEIETGSRREELLQPTSGREMIPAGACFRNGTSEANGSQEEARGAVENFEQRLDKWGGLAKKIADSGECDGRDWSEVKQQLARLELQQGRLMTMLQDMVSHSQNAIDGVESRVSSMERRLEAAVAQQPYMSNGINGSGSAGRGVNGYGLAGNGINGYGLAGNGMNGYGFAGNGNGGQGSPSGQSSDGAFASSPIRRLSRPSDGGSGRWNGTQMIDQLSPLQAEDSYSYRPSPLREQLIRRAPEESPPPSATLPQSRAPPFDFVDINGRPSTAFADVSKGDDLAARARRLSFGEGGSTSRRSSGGGSEAAIRGGKAWSSALEWLRHGKTEEAYLEVLGLGDELQLIRLLGRTGPVLSELSPSTAAEVVAVLAVLLKQESFVDVILPWMRQLADRRSDTCLSRGLQREVVWALQVIAGQPTLNGSEAAKLVTTLCALWAPAFV